MIADLGLVDYEEAYKVQREFVSRRKLGEIDDSLILAEHPNVFTIGRSGKREKAIAGEDKLKETDLAVLNVDRGGAITFHGPGQLVLYPIVDLNQRSRDLHRYLRDLEELAIRFLRGYSVFSGRVKDRTGVWVGDKKIASIGVAASNWITYHGISINLNTDMRFFSMINPCGMKDVEMTSLAGILARDVSMPEAKERAIGHFNDIFYPAWLKKTLITSSGISEMKKSLSETGVRTVCESSLCPNLNECFSRRHATFLMLGNSCTRSCGFCCVKKGTPCALDASEPEKILASISRLNLKHVVITSVTRDDLRDGGARQFAELIAAIRKYSGSIRIEVLVPDFRGEKESIGKVVAGGPDILAHNMETVKRLYPIVRRGADYKRSLGILRFAKDINPGQITKSGIMVGLGETDHEVIDTIKDIRTAECSILTIGQYLRPRRENLPVERFVRPEGFERYREIAADLGFKKVFSGPFVRSSYKAEEMFHDGCEIAAYS